MTSTRSTVKCVGCGKIDEQELAFLESINLPPRIIQAQLLSPAEDESAKPKEGSAAFAEEVVT